MVDALTLVRSEFILGGQKSGKSRRAEQLARAWLDRGHGHQAVLIATACAGDEEMRRRIERHQADRAARVPGMRTLEEPRQLAQAIGAHSRADTLVVVDCLTLWLTNLLMPLHPAEPLSSGVNQAEGLVAVEPVALFLEAISAAPGPIVVVGNEIGMGVIPMGAEVRAFVDTLGRLNQEVSRVCARVTLMVAGLPLTLKDSPDHVV